jgi:hypothetical protein
VPALPYWHSITTTGSSCYRPRVVRSEAIGSTAARISAARSGFSHCSGTLGLSLREIAALLNTLVARGAEPLVVTLRGSGRRCVSGATALIASCGPLNMHNGAHRTQRNQSGSSTRPS